jgi:hypothetical protein
MIHHETYKVIKNALDYARLLFTLVVAWRVLLLILVMVSFVFVKQVHGIMKMVFHVICRLLVLLSIMPLSSFSFCTI